VQYWDYVGSMKNFSWIGNIYEQYKEFPWWKSREQNWWTKASKFQLLWWNKSSQEHEIDLSELGFTISKLKNELPNNLTKEQLFQTLWNYEWKTEQESYDYFMWLTYKWIKKLEIWWNKVLFLRTLSWIQSEWTVETPSWFQEWIEKVFAWKNIVKQHILTKEQLLQTLWNYEWRSEQESYDYFIWLTYKWILDLEIWWNKVLFLRTLSWIQSEWTVETPSWFQEWIEKVFAWKNIVKQHILTKEQLLQTLWNYEWRSEQESYDYFMWFSQKWILNLDILWNKANSLRTVSWIQIEWMIETPSWFQEWIEKVFAWKNIVKQHILTKEQLLQTLWNYEWRSEQESYDYLMWFSRKWIQDLEIWWKKVRSLLTLSWIDIKWDIQTLSWFQEWIRKVFEWKNIVKQEILTKEQLLQTLWNYEWRSEQESYDYFMWFSRKWIQDLEIWWKKVTSLRTVSWIETEWNIEASSWFQEWIRKVFEWKNIVKQEILTKEQLLQTLWNYEWKNEQESYDYLMWFTKKWIYDLEIWWNKVTSLLTLSWIEIEWKITILSWFQEWIGKVFEWKKIIRKR
jgi:DNA-binding response OmpR family regulator